ncbi:PAS domain-containing protein, partial [Streptomyces sp. NPDC048551]|uniref:PAS domain-containing protein n=1 Tax=Streptomyces sp. NPDC048551 TaxID=3155758 RepID=UPI003425AE41
MSGTPEGTGPAADTIRSALTERHPAVAAVPRDYRAAFDAAHLAMALVDRDGEVVASNRALAALLGSEQR